MGTVTGTTQDKLHLIKTYDPTQPYIVGQNGVTNMYIDSDGIENITYILDEIEYNTKLIKKILKAGKGPGITAINFNNPINSTKSYVPNLKGGGVSGVNITLDTVYPTTFKYTTQPTNDNVNHFVFKDEVKMGVVFKPKVLADIFIERQSISIFESQTRLGEITSLQGLEDYNNGFYNIEKTE
jgi:hypothetical protein